MGRACGTYEGEVKKEWWWMGVTWGKENTWKTYVIWQDNIKIVLQERGWKSELEWCNSG